LLAAASFEVIIILQSIFQLSPSISENYDKVKTINIPSSISIISDQAFKDCTSLTKLKINNKEFLSNKRLNFVTSGVVQFFQTLFLVFKLIKSQFQNLFRLKIIGIQDFLYFNQ
jgi:hypothetical protein